jgi:FKBP12-rapamycin complex-associated protein
MRNTRTPVIKMAPDYVGLTLIQKVEAFEYALSMTTGRDLCKVMWIKSRNTETWLDRRTNYTRSLAVMSVVGYILGLGDRHPCNLMLDRNSGKIIHIDFGDCFEVAMHVRSATPPVWRHFVLRIMRSATPV